MIDVQEHFYDDDPAKGHPDVRTRLKDVSYFFLGNGFIQASVQIAPGGEGTPVGLLIMNPEYLGKKREALTMEPDTGLEKTMVRLRFGSTIWAAGSSGLEAGWQDQITVPAVRVLWKNSDFRVVEHFFCPDFTRPVLLRKVRIKHLGKRKVRAFLQTGLLDRIVEQELAFELDQEKHIFLRYSLDESRTKVFVDIVPSEGPGKEAIDYWKKKAFVSFHSSLLDHYFRAARFQLPAVISDSGKVDGSIWQYNREWVRDQAMMVVGLTISGHHDIAGKILKRLLTEFVTDEGDTVDSSERRHPDDVELDQNGVLLYALKNYVFWTGDHDLVSKMWEKIVSAVEFPLRDVFRHQPSGLLANQREYWERHRIHGIEKGLELAHQLWTALGLFAAAEFAHSVSRRAEALRWEKEAKRIKEAMLHDRRFKLVDERGFIKRRKIDGSVQESLRPLPEARLPIGVPLASRGVHFLNPDASASLPVALGFIPYDSIMATSTMNSLETLWNQAWEGGGYGRYHFSSEPDSPGSWPFPSLFIARACVETGKYDDVWRVLRWLNTLPGAMAGTWFEFYGQRVAPPFPQVGIPPWTWAEMLILFVHHILGIRPEAKHIRLKPRLLPGIEKVNASFPLREGRLHLEIQKREGREPFVIHSNGTIIHSSEKDVCLSYSKRDIWAKVFVS